ncbi:MAG: hypothetical protein R3Y51_02315 [Rikenellaceae bacterium]
MKKSILFLSAVALSFCVMTSYAKDCPKEGTCTEQKTEKKGECTKADSTSCTKKDKACKKTEEAAKSCCSAKTDVEKKD